jgi:hypothetical protein
MKRLYNNKYAALNGEGKDLDERAHVIAKDLFEVCENKGLDLRDAEAVITHSIHGLFAALRLKNALRAQKAERDSRKEVR